MFKNKLKHVVKAIIMRNSKMPQMAGLSQKNKNLRVIDLYILKHLETPMTDEQLTRAYNRVRNRPASLYESIRRRRSSLVNYGLVRDTGAVTKGKYGRNMTLWTSTLSR
jgi:hypothetical protein